MIAALAALTTGVMVLAYALLRARRKRLDLALAGVVMLGLGGVMLRPEPAPQEASAAQTRTFTTVQPSGPAVALTDLEFRWEDELLYLVGTLRNTTGRALAGGNLDIALFDDHGQELGRVGASYTRIENLGANEARAFRAWIPFEEAREARVVSLWAY
jgi:hypothetical protein